MDGYNNDYNKDLYNVDSSNFCKSCYSSQKGRAGCLVAVAVAAAVLAAHAVIANFTTPKTATVAVAAGLVLFFGYRLYRRKRKS